MQDPCSCGVCLTPKGLQGDRYALLSKARLHSLNTAGAQPPRLLKISYINQEGQFLSYSKWRPFTFSLSPTA